MKRWVLNLAAATSLMLCVAVCVLWAISRWRGGSTWQSSQGGATRFVILDAGTLQWVRQAATPEGSGELQADTSHLGEVTFKFRGVYVVYPISADNPQPSTRVFGFKCADRRMTVSEAFGPLPIPIEVSQRSLAVPLWPIAVVFALLPCAGLIAVLHRGQRRLRMQTGRCAHCNYDLRGGHDRCPECGKATC